MSETKKKLPSDRDPEESSDSNGVVNSEEESSSEHSEGTKDEVGRSKVVASDIHIENKKNEHRRSKKQDITFVCNALSNYSAKEVGELSFEKGEMLTIIGVRKDGWWEAKNSDDVQGLVPSTFLKIPDHMNELINETMQSNDSKDIHSHFWKGIRSSIRKSQAMKTALQTFGSVGYPLGFRNCMLGCLFKEDKNFSAEAFLKPKLSDTGLSFEDIQWETLPTANNRMSLQLKPITTVLQKVIQLVALRQIIPPPTGYEVTSRHVHMCLHDGNKVLSNIHTTQANWDAKNPKIWFFSNKIAGDSSCLEEGQIFLRSNKSFATLGKKSKWPCETVNLLLEIELILMSHHKAGILFELCISYKKKETSEISEMSCGWAFMRLLNDSGLPVKSKTKILKIHNSVPFTNYFDETSASLSSLQKLMNRNKQPRMVITISSPKRSNTQQICYLPSTIIGPVSSIHLMALYRKIAANILLERTSFDSADLIQSPFLSNFPRILNEPDLTDFFQKVWFERLKHDKRHDLRSEGKKESAFQSLFMETAFLILNSCSLPPYSLGDNESGQERKAILMKIHSFVNVKDPGILALFPDLNFKPLSVQMLSAHIV